MEYTFDEMTVSDLHKDAYGFRPGSYFWSLWMAGTDDEKQAMWDQLLVALEQSIQEERDRHTRAEARFAKMIAENMLLGAPDEETAVRWILEAEELSDYDMMYGADYVAHLFDLPYKGTYDTLIRTVLATMEPARYIEEEINL